MHNPPVTILYHFTGTVQAPHYGHPLTISRYTEETTRLKPLQGAPRPKPTSDINKPHTKFCKRDPPPPPKSTPYRLYSL
jgi:hypothetical protein